MQLNKPRINNSLTDAYKILAEMPEESRGASRHIWKDNTKVDLCEHSTDNTVSLKERNVLSMVAFCFATPSELAGR